MAKKRSKEQLQADKIIKSELLKLGDKVLDIAQPNSRRDTGRLQDEMNFRVIKDTTLMFGQMYYGAFNYPKGKTNGEKNALNIALQDNVNETTNIIVKNINDVLLAPFKDKK